MNNNEVWRDIPNFEGLYQVSNIGRVKSLGNKRNHKEEMILKPSINIYGYYHISLNKKNKRYSYCVHRLVALAFLENPYNLKTVNHIDKNKLNNNVENLEYMSIGDNVRYSLNKPVLKMDLQGNLIEEYPSINEAGRRCNVFYQNIYKCCKGKRLTAGGYRWRYKNESEQ